MILQKSSSKQVAMAAMTSSSLCDRHFITNVAMAYAKRLRGKKKTARTQPMRTSGSANR